MNCEQLKKIIPGFLMDDVDETVRTNAEAHLLSCPACKHEVETVTNLWTKLGSIPAEQPSAALRPRFDTMLEAYKQGVKQAKSGRSLYTMINSWLEKWYPKQPIFQFATAVLLLFLGVIIGSRFNILGTHNGDMAQLRSEVQNMRRTVAISLLKQPSASGRLQGVSLSYQLDQPSSEILTTLLDALNHDPNVNVRLATLDALYLFSDRPTIREGLVESLTKQKSPLVQIAIIDLLVDIREKKSIQALRQLIEDNHLIPEVRERAKWGIGQL